MAWPARQYTAVRQYGSTRQAGPCRMAHGFLAGSAPPHRVQCAYSSSQVLRAAATSNGSTQLPGWKGWKGSAACEGGARGRRRHGLTKHRMGGT
jgi:hypothetical protein